MQPSVNAIARMIIAGTILSAAALAATTSTRTDLSVEPGGHVAIHDLVTITAKVTDANSVLLTRGTVSLLDGKVTLATVQIISSAAAGYSPGTAIFRTRALVAGSHHLTAHFNKLKAYAPSTSGEYVVNVKNTAAPIASSLTLDSYLASASSYTLSAEVTSASTDFPVLPTGAVLFRDVTHNQAIGSVDLSTYGQGLTYSSQELARIGYPGTAAAADFNNDGNQDILLAPQQNGALVSIYVFPGNGDGTFKQPLTIQVPFSGDLCAVTDLNGDGVADIFFQTRDRAGGAIWVLLGNGDGTFQAPASYSFPLSKYSYGGPATGDFNGDGYLDVIANGEFLLTGNGDGTFQTATDLASGTAPFPTYLNVAGDLNNDGIADLVVADGILPGNGIGGFGKEIPFPSGTITSISLAADLNGDGKLDLVGTAIADQPKSWTTSPLILLGKGNGSFSLSALPTLDGYYDVVGSAPFNGDQSLDLALASADNFATEVILRGQGDGTFRSPEIIQLPLLPGTPTNGYAPPAVALSDFSNNGYPDFINALGVNGGINNPPAVVLLGKSTGFYSSLTFRPPATNTPTQVVATYSGDSTYTGSTSNPVLLSNKEFVSVMPATVQFPVAPVPNYFTPYPFNNRQVMYVVVANSTSLTLRLSPALRPSSDPSFSINQNCTQIAPKSTCSIVVFHSTQTAGTASGILNLNFINAPPGTTSTVTVQGTTTNNGVYVSLQSFALPVTATGSNVVRKVASIYNDQDAVLTFAPAITGDPSFRLTKTCTQLQRFSSCPLEVTYTPTNAGTQSANLSLNFANAPAGTQTAIALTGTAVTPRVLVSRLSHSFVADVDSSQSGRVYLTNNTSSVVNLNPIISGDASFHLAANCQMLQPYQICGIDISFAPSRTGTFLATLSLNFTNAPSATPATVSLSGLSVLPQVLISRSSYKFESAVNTSQDGRIYITNNTTSAVQLNPIVSGDPAFALSYTCTILQPYQQCGVQVTYSPTKAGSASAVLSLNFVKVPAGTSDSIGITGVAQ